MINNDATRISVSELPIAAFSFSLSLAPKYWETRIPDPVEIAINMNIKKKMIGVVAPIAASAVSPT